MSYQHIFKKSVNFYHNDFNNNGSKVRLQRSGKFHLVVLSSLLLTLLLQPVTAASAKATTNSLPRYSKLVPVDQQQFHIRQMGPVAPAIGENLPVVVLLAGPNQNFHADSAWFALLQPLLAQKYQVLAIDRLGNGFSDNAKNVSYQRFSQDLTALLPTLTSKPVILVSFASASISASLFHQQHQQAKSASQVQAMVWIDPDIPTPAALALYQGYPVDWYQKHLQQLLPELAKGVWNQRTLDKLTAERTEVAALLSSDHQASMDWTYFDAISRQRQSTQRQQQRAIEIANYAKDLDLYAALPAITDVPVTVIDSDFESMDITALLQVAAKHEANQSEKAQQEAAQAKTQLKALQQWQQQGSSWSKQLATNSGGQYIPLQNSHHLVMFQHPQKIVAAIDWLIEKVAVTPSRINAKKASSTALNNSAGH